MGKINKKMIQQNVMDGHVGLDVYDPIITKEIAVSYKKILKVF